MMAALWHFWGLRQDQDGAGDGTMWPQGSIPPLLPKHGVTNELPFWTTAQELKLVAMPHRGVMTTVAPVSWGACHVTRGTMDMLGQGRQSGCVGPSPHLTSGLKTALGSREQ